MKKNIQNAILLLVTLFVFACAEKAILQKSTEPARDPQAILQPSTNTHNPQIAGPNNCKNAKRNYTLY